MNFKYYLEKCYEDLFDLLISIPKDKSLIIKRVILEQNKISNICFNSQKDLVELKVSVKYILFILNFFLNNNLIEKSNYELIRFNYNKLYLNLL